MLYEFRIFCYYRENTKWNQQLCTILHAKTPKTGKKLELEDSIPSKYEFRLLIVNDNGIDRCNNICGFHAYTRAHSHHKSIWYYALL